MPYLQQQVLVNVVHVLLLLTEDADGRCGLLQALQKVHDLGLVFDVLHLSMSAAKNIEAHTGCHFVGHAGLPAPQAQRKNRGTSGTFMTLLPSFITAASAASTTVPHTIAPLNKVINSSVCQRPSCARYT